MTVGRLAVGTFGGHVGPHALIASNTVAAALALGLTLVAPTLGVAAAGFALLGVALANVFPAVIALGAAACPRAAGTVTGILIAASGMGAAVFPWLAGVVGERAGLGAALGGCFGLLAAMLAAARLAQRLDRGARAESALASP
jgi:fucose permease